jgi:hypothetical protein
MLNNLTNLFNLIKSRMVKTVLENDDLIVAGTKDGKYNGGYKPTIIKFSDLAAQLNAGEVESVTDDGNGVVSVDNTDPANPVIEFDGVNTDSVTIIGDGTSANPLKLAPVAFGQISKMDTATIPVVTQNVYQSLGLTGTLDTISTGIVLGTTDTFAVKNITGETKTFLIYGSVDMGVSIPGDTIMGIKLALNGVVIDSTECKAWSIGGKAGKLVTNWMIEMDDDDEVALYVANFTNTTSISFSRARLVATPV